MCSANRPGHTERALLAAGTASYDFPDFGPLGKVRDALQSVVEVLKDLDFTTVVPAPGYHLDPALASLRAAVRKAAAAAPVVVVYYTGHGADLERDTYYLVSKKSRAADLDESALAARDLLTLLTLRDDQGSALTGQPTVLVILDCCYSGSAAMTMLEAALHGIGNPNTWVIASAGPLEYAQEGLFARAFCDALRRPTAGPSQRFVSLEAIAQSINDARAGQAQQEARVFPPGAGLTGIPPFFPNLYHQHGLAGMTVADQQHWLSRVRGGPGETTAGFYLTGKTGRLRAAEDLAQWLSNPGRRRLAVITGSPGTGKSALLALPALLTEQSQRQSLLDASAPGSLIEHTARLLPVDTPVTAIHARGLNTDQTAGAIAQALSRDASTASGLLEVLDIAPQQDERIVVVDAVDEAISPATLLGGLLVPLSRHPGVRVVVGARRHVLGEGTDIDTTIDLDTDVYRDPQALTGYIHRLLIAAEEPGVATCYRPASGGSGADPSVAAAVAEAIAQRATAREAGAESFLIGRLLALAVRDRPEPADVTSRGWRSELPASVAEAFDEDLARLGDKQALARAMLEALAWAKGPGLPWETIWVPVAKALAVEGDAPYPSTITNDDVRWLLDKAGAYVVEDVGPSERSVFRPFHDLLATHLRGEPSSEQTKSDPATKRNQNPGRDRAEKAITNALLATVPAIGETQRDWLSAHPYLRTYLVQHAAVAGIDTLATLLKDMDFLAVADPVTLSPLLSLAVPELRDAARIYRRARPLLGDDARANAAHLQEADRALMGAAATSLESGIRPQYATLLSSVRRDDSLFTVTGHNGRVNTVAFGTAEGRLVLASAGHDRKVRLWDPVTGTRAGEPLTGHTGEVTSVAFGTSADGHLLLASASYDETIRLWDPATGTPAGEPLTGHTRGVTSVAFGTTADGHLLLASASYDETIRLWDPATGASAGGPFIGAVSSVAFGTTADGHLLLASASHDETIRLWDPATGASAGEFPTGHTRGVTSVAFGTSADGHLLLAYAGRTDTVRLWDPVTGTPAGEFLNGHTGGVTAVAFGTSADGHLHLASASYDETIRLWDPVTRIPVGEPFTGHTDEVTSVAFGTSADGRLHLASAAHDETVRLWDPVTGTPTGVPFTGHTRGVTSVAFGTTADGQLLLASASHDRMVRLWDPVTGTSAGNPLTGHGSDVTSVAFGTTADGQLLLASASHDWTVRLWDPVTRTAVGELFLGHTNEVASVAFGTTADGRLLLASASHDWTVRLWDPVTGTSAGEPLTGHTGGVTSVAFGTTADGRLLLASASQDETVRLWDPVTGTSAGEPLTGHTRPVTSVAFGTSADGHLHLASASYDGTVRLWDAAAKAHATTFHRRSSVWSVAIFGGLLAIGDEEGVCIIEPLL